MSAARAAIGLAALALAAVAGCGSTPASFPGYAPGTGPSATRPAAPRPSGPHLTAACETATMSNGDPGYALTLTNTGTAPGSVYGWTVALISDGQEQASSTPGPFAAIGVAAGQSFTVETDTYTSSGTTGSIWAGGMSCKVVSLQTLP